MAGAGLCTSWALPPQPPEEWVGSRGRTLLLAALAGSVALLMLQPDVIELHSTLSRDVHRDERQRDVVRALLGLAAEVGALVLAEGVETEEQLQALRELGVPLGQGWHLGVPVVVTERAV